MATLARWKKFFFRRTFFPGPLYTHKTVNSFVSHVLRVPCIPGASFRIPSVSHFFSLSRMHSLLLFRHKHNEYWQTSYPPPFPFLFLLLPLVFSSLSSFFSPPLFSPPFSLSLSLSSSISLFFPLLVLEAASYWQAETNRMRRRG